MMIHMSTFYIALMHTHNSIDFVGYALDQSLKHCGIGYFNCGETCISEILVCDGSSDCANGEDEHFRICTDNKCPPYAFRCTFGHCINKDKVCDGIKNCFDDRDEDYQNCAPIYPDCGLFLSEDVRDIFPWHAGVWMETDEGPIKICAATIVAPKYLISAADCFWNITSNAMSRNEFIITAELKNNSFEQHRKVKEIFFNDYKNTQSESNINNIAVVEVFSSFVFNDFTSAACLPDYRRNISKINLYNFEVEEIITWSPGPFNYDGPQRLFVERHAEPRINSAYQSEINNTETKYVSQSAACGPLSDHGGGSFLNIRGRYFLKAVLNPTLGDIHIMSCVNRIYTYILPHIPFIRAFTNNDELSKDVPEDNNRKFNLYVDIFQPETLYEKCGQFNIFDTRNIFPWHAMVWQESHNGPKKLCSATIVKENIAISAASCFWNTTANTLYPYSYTVTADFSNGAFKQYGRVRNILIQDYYTTRNESYVNNVAILVFMEPFNFNENIKAACVYDPKILPDIPVPLKYAAMASPWSFEEQIQVAFVWNSMCNPPLSEKENFQFCGDISDYRINLDDEDIGFGVFVIEGGIYFLRGVLNPYKYPFYHHQTFTNVLPFIHLLQNAESTVETSPPVNGDQPKQMSDRNVYMEGLAGSVKNLEFENNTAKLTSLYISAINVDLTLCHDKNAAYGECSRIRACEDGSYNIGCDRKNNVHHCTLEFCASGIYCIANITCGSTFFIL